jgi:hypothetical protein
MIWAAKQLLTPCNYLRIKQGDTLLQSKAVYDFVLPIILTVATSAIGLALSTPLSLNKHPGLVKSITDLLALLIAFYMAALAAVATFQRDGLDNSMAGSPATLRRNHKESGYKFNQILSYRQFIAYLFGYLSFLSLLLFTFLVLLVKAYPLAVKKIGTNFPFSKFIYQSSELIIFFAFFFALWQLVTTSMLGIHFLAERLQNLKDDGA